MDAPTPLGELVLKLRAESEPPPSWGEIAKRLGKSRQAVQQAANPRARREAQRRYEKKFLSGATR